MFHLLKIAAEVKGILKNPSFKMLQAQLNKAGKFYSNEHELRFIVVKNGKEIFTADASKFVHFDIAEAVGLGTSMKTGEEWWNEWEGDTITENDFPKIKSEGLIEWARKRVGWSDEEN